MDLGNPISYLTLEEGAPVYAAGGERVGTVTHVLAAPDEDIFDGFVVESSLGSGGHRFVDATQVAEIHERGVLLAIDAGDAESLPEPSANPAALDAGPDETVPDRLHDKLKRAWDRISGDY
jgi:uncharacterized protein YrrD